MPKLAGTDGRCLNGSSEAEDAGLAQESSAEEKEHSQIEATDTEDPADQHVKRCGRTRLSSLRSAIVVGAAVVVAVGSLAGWLGYRTYETRQAHAQRNQWVAVARQGALNLTTIDYTEVDTDVQRILDSSTGAFRDDFKKRSQPFIEVVKKAKSKTQGAISEAGLESQQGDQARVLIAVSVKTSNAGVSEQVPRRWRMRISVERVGDDAKVSDVEFVP